MKKKIDKNILLILIPLAILGGIAYMTTRPGGYIREEPHRVVDSEWTSQNIYDVKNYSNYALSKDEEYVIYTVLESSRDGDSIRVNTVAQNKESGDRMLLLRGSSSISDFHIDPETNQMFFLTEESGKTQVFKGEFREGRIVGIEQVSNSTTGVLEWKLSRDGKKVAYTQLRRALDDNGIEKLGKLNQTDLFLAEPSKSDAKLTESDIVINSMDWAPDGKHIVYEYYSSQTSGEYDYDASLVQYKTKIREINIDTRTPIDLELDHYGNANPKYSLDGKYIAYTSERSMELGPFGTRDIKVYDRDTGGVELMGTSPNGRPTIEGWMESDRLYISDKDKMVEKLYSYSLDGSLEGELIESKSSEAKFKVDDSLKAIYYLDEARDRPVEVYAFDMASKTSDRITDENQRLLEKDVANTELISWDSEGDLKIEGIIGYPKAYSSSESYTLIVDIYDGIDNRFTDGYTNPLVENYPSSVLQEQGYMVLKINVRGTDGYGEKHRSSVIGDLGKDVNRDIELGVEALRNLVEADIDRIGLVSWGYGSYNSAISIAESDVFSFGILGGPISNLATFLDTTDRNYLSEIYFGGDALENGEIYHENSPVNRMGSAPILMIHGSYDRFVPFSQSSIYYNRLRENKINSTVTLYPKSSHKIEIPKHKTDYIDQSIDWIEKTGN